MSDESRAVNHSRTINGPYERRESGSLPLQFSVKKAHRDRVPPPHHRDLKGGSKDVDGFTIEDGGLHSQGFERSRSQVHIKDLKCINVGRRSTLLSPSRLVSAWGEGHVYDLEPPPLHRRVSGSDARSKSGRLLVSINFY